MNAPETIDVRLSAQAPGSGNSKGNWWMRQLEDLISAGIILGQLAPCDTSQLAFEIQGLLGAGSHQYRLRNDPHASARSKTAVLQRLEGLRGPQFPALAETLPAALSDNGKPRADDQPSQRT